MITVESFFNHDMVLNLLNNISDKYKHIYTKRKNEYYKKIGKRKTKLCTSINIYNYKIEYKILAEDCIRINVREFENNNFSKTIGTDIYVYKNKLYRADDTYNFNKKYEVAVFNNNYDFDKLDLFLTNEINKIINNSISYICVDCKSKFNLSIGEFNFLINKKFKLPCRCKSCRSKRKQLNNIQEDINI